MPKPGFTVASYRRRRRRNSKTRSSRFTPYNLSNDEWITKIKPTGLTPYNDSNYQYGSIITRPLIKAAKDIEEKELEKQLNEEWDTLITDPGNTKWLKSDFRCNSQWCDEYIGYLNRAYYSLDNNKERVNWIKKIKEHCVVTPYQQVYEDEDEDGITEPDSDSDSDYGTADNPIDLC